MELLPLEGFVVAVTADRRSEEQAELLRRRGAEVIHAPTIETTYLASDRRLRDATAAVIADPPSHLVVTTGIGIRAWFEATQSWGLDGALLEALRAARVIARGPKAAAAAQVVGLSIARTAHDERMHGVREVLMEEQLDGASIAVQCFGDEQVPESEFLAAAGANVVAVPVYRYQMPSDDQPAQLLVEAAIDARVHAVTFTAAPAVRNLFTMAKVRGVQDDLRAALNERVVPACVGPACAEAARELGITELVAPDVGRLGLLVRALSDRLSIRRRVLLMGGATVVLQGNAGIVAGRRVRFTQREAAVFETLLARHGAVVSRASLHRAVWNGDGDDHIVAVTIARLRAKLGPAGPAIRAVPRRGYRIDAETGKTTR